jgi:hypothetical protein
VGARALVESLATWRYLDLSNLDASTPTWVALQVGDMRQRFATSSELAERYLMDFRAAETGEASGALVRPTFNAVAAEATLLSNGPRLTKMLIGRGAAPQAAFARAAREVLGRSQKWALAGGRQTIIGSAGANPRTRRWRRVSDGSPCAFCAMLLVRSITRGDQPPDFDAHTKCGCTAEEVFDDIPTTDVEDEWIDAYNQAARQAKLAGEPIVAPNRNNRRDTVLWRMRRNRPDLFSDGVHPH